MLLILEAFSVAQHDAETLCPWEKKWQKKSIKCNHYNAVLMLRETFCCRFQVRRYSSGCVIFETITASLVLQSPGTDANKWNKVTLSVILLTKRQQWCRFNSLGAQTLEPCTFRSWSGRKRRIGAPSSFRMLSRGRAELQRWLAMLLCFAAGRNNAADPLLCHTGQDNYGDGIRTTVVAVIISNRRDLIVSPQCGGLLPEVSAVRVRSGHYLIDLLCIHHNTWSPKWIWNSARDELVIKYPW